MSKSGDVKKAKLIPQDQLQKTVEKIVHAELYRGPLPPPNLLKQFDEVYPGAAEIIIRTFESQTNHRISQESKVVDSNIANEKRGQFFAFTIAVIVIVAGIVFIAVGKTLGGLIGLLAPLAVLVGLFFGGKSSSKRQLMGKGKP